MGTAYLSEGEIKILCSRKIGSLKRGLTSNEILAYLFFKLHSMGGIVQYFSYSELSQYAGISLRDVYHIIERLRKAGLISIDGKEYGHSKTVRIIHYKKEGPQGRFLSLNRTFFQEGEEDYESFKKLRAGAKSTLLYLLFREKFRKNERGETTSKSFGNSIEVTMSDIVKITKVQKDTAILYIKDINEKLHGLFNVVRALDGTVTDRRIAYMQDKRIIYGGVTSSAARRALSTTENKAYGFWRRFDMWMMCHGFSIDLIANENAVRKPGEFFASRISSQEERTRSVRDNFFNTVLSLLKEGVNWKKIYNEAYRLISAGGGLHEVVPAYMYVGLSPSYQSKIQSP